MNTLKELDHEVFLFLNNLGTETWDPFWLFLTNKWSSIPLYAFLLFLIYKKFGLKGTLYSLVAVALLITATDQLANVFKHGFERLRPCRQEGVMEQARFIAVRCGSYGYFSAHAASSMALAVFVGLILKSKYKWIFPVLLVWALLVGYSRIYVGVHYPGDVLTGIIIGALIALLVYALHRFGFAKLFKETY
ncbi:MULTISPECIES: phosphatase PAP2 family protein [Leeuwenhoekiella]|jgi:undecaprenyl-diphosphatase|uniref:Putative membrane-associated phospholipid phosphatase n=1 Tax=Leeuwenhoekiella blandensis (strain CECT 7118 / CCUG 51940 / KCTC 22103 / MED217) TaxID=398720 RepID=A3XLB2_LEEBM|nr:MULTISPECIES: phosphatase PAP2 family protein [Leeuwenhoekiella]EAQ49657.1 putative membrane-associated phospholipid phosphatase [Leeuwenhoekiella blandensis MED217]MAO42246.1 phosphatase PAP2 family protein [Leeuwenhoekiella sp.]HCW63499.1 phosphatase PAP2 family protein [Leeuwenhoekiella sp.]|tara:strand:- start:5216 stop:5788 length:573 start_codon:yes stop_codon:yes gene_type:complete